MMEKLNLESLSVAIGDFRSPECINILKNSDIVITNPPFSIFRDFIKLLMQYEKKFLVIGNINAAITNDIFPFIRDRKLWLGFNKRLPFEIPNTEDEGTHLANLPFSRWFTNLESSEQKPSLKLTKKYSEDAYRKFVNYDKAINVDKLSDIPADYQRRNGCTYHIP